MTKKLNIAALPELKTSVGIYASTKQKEVTGPLCVGIALGVIIWNA